MCLGIPGKIESITEGDLRPARVSFGGNLKEVSLVYTPEAQVGEYVIVHAGFAISRVNEEEARQTFAYLEQLEKEQK